MSTMLQGPSMKLVLLILFSPELVQGLLEVDTDYHNHVGVPAATLLRAAEGRRRPGVSKIVGGSPAAPGKFGYFGGLIIDLVDGRTSLCGSTLLSPTRAVTAAHCWTTKQAQARQFTVVLGSIKLFSGGTRVVTSDVQVHASYNIGTLANDIAIIRLPKIQYNENIRGIAIATGSNNFVSTVATAVGFGATAEGAPITSEQSLSQVSMRVITNSECSATYGDNFVLPSTLCTSTKDGHSSCGGDSGGPLVANNQLIGVTSYSVGCQKGNPIGFSRVTFYAPWIKERL